MTRLAEGPLTFDFPDSWKATKFDDWSYYRNQFAKIKGTKAVDFVAIGPDLCCWCIEVKDYRHSKRTKAIDLADEVALKVRDTLAALASARVNANDGAEKELAAVAMRSRMLRVVLHLEQASKPSKLFPRAIDPSKVEQQLKQLIKAIDPHPRVFDKESTIEDIWTVV